jgi:hypothetical protein
MSVPQVYPPAFMTLPALIRPRCLLLVAVLGAILGWRSIAVPASAPPVSPREQATPEAAATLVPADDLFARLGVERARRAGWRGQGMTVAVLDSGFRGYRSALGRALPADVEVKSFERTGNLEARDSQHGILCAEVVHSLAPDAKLLLANWDTENPESFLAAVRWAKGRGAKVCTCSLIMPSWSDGDGGGRIHAELARLLGDGRAPGDMLFCACAGNIAQRHWSGKLRPDAGGYHQWQAGQVSNPLTPWDAERVMVELYGQLTTPCMLQVWSGRNLIGETKLMKQPEGAWSKASVRVEPQPGQKYQVCVRWLGTAPPAETFHVVALGGYLGQWTSERSIPFPGDGARVLTVGAVDRGGQRTFYSSCGPNSKEPKPDFVAEVPIPTRLREKPFSGTSAAAPQAAGLAALLWSGHSDWTASQVASTLRASALDLGPPGHDFETGFGLLRLP